MLSGFFKKRELTRNELKKIGLGDEIRRYRNERCYSQEYLASQLGVTQSTYQRIESGAINITSDRLEQIAKIFNLPLEAFLKENEKLKGELFLIEKKELDSLKQTILSQKEKIEQLEKLLTIKKISYK
ncbi:helix-turn-helix transcriptional regulator [Pedobacter sp.]|uniref:helix-turn-helix domain-containing protein n=1 Tax=Pedobacter sp. TaxID=1411316 RepID=UPI0031D101AC